MALQLCHMRPGVAQVPYSDTTVYRSSYQQVLKQRGIIREEPFNTGWGGGGGLEFFFGGGLCYWTKEGGEFFQTLINVCVLVSRGGGTSIQKRIELGSQNHILWRTICSRKHTIYSGKHTFWVLRDHFKWSIHNVGQFEKCTYPLWDYSLMKTPIQGP